MRRRCCGRCYKKTAVSSFVAAKSGGVFRQPIFLLLLHSLFRSRDTSSVSLTLDTFTPESRALGVLRPSDALGVQAPPRGRLAKCDTLRFFLRCCIIVFFAAMENYRSKRLPLGRPAKPLRSAAAPSCLFDNPAARGYTEGGEIIPFSMETTTRRRG